MEIIPNPPVTPIKPEKNILLINRCCSAGKSLLENYIQQHPECQWKANKVGIFNAHKNKLDIKYGFSVKEDLEKNISILVVDGKIVAKG